MSDSRTQRRLAAILAADVVGYSGLMARDEQGTLDRLKRLRTDFMNPRVEAHGGRIVKLMGDGALVEFTSVIDALECAVSLQQSLARENARTAEEERITLRIGINLGEVIVEGDDIYGDGVNVASRLESLAEPGGVVISAAAQEQARGKVDLLFRDLGEQSLKNMPQAVRVFSVTPPEEGGGGHELNRGVPVPAPKRRLLPLAALGLLLLLAAAGWWWMGTGREGAPETAADSAADSATENGSGRDLAAVTAEDKPSIVVVPFDNLSGSQEQAYFADGMTESLITDLSRLSGLLVIARNTSFTLKDQPLDLDSISQELGVRYVLEGSIQKAGDRVRINANLIDARSGYQIWAEKLDRQLVDLFALQDEITGKVIAALKVEMTQEERRNLAKAYTDSLEAYDLYLRAWQQYWEYNDQARSRARALLNQALALDPRFARAQALLAMSYTSQVGASLDESNQDLERARALANEAVAMDPQLPQVHWVLGLVHMFLKDYEQAEASTRRAIELDPNFADAYGLLCWILQYAGEAERGLEVMETALRLNPRAPFPYLSAEAEAYFSLERYDEAVEISRVAIERNPTGQRLRLFMAASLALSGHLEDAAWEIEELLLLEPRLSLSAVPDIAPYRDPAVVERLQNGLRIAGLPD